MGHWVCYTVLTVQHYQCPMDTEVTISRIIEITGCGIMSVSHTPNQARVEFGAAPLVQHYSVFSDGPDLGYGKLIQCGLGITEQHTGPS